MLFEVSTDDDALGYQVGMHTQNAAILAFEGSWLNVLAVAHQEPKTCVADLLNEVLATARLALMMMRSSRSGSWRVDMGLVFNWQGL